MQDRTNNRKKDDLKLLFEEKEKEPDNPRNLYYIAETYLCLKDWENAYSYYEQRTKVIDGFSQEVQDCLYKMAVIAQFNLKHDWTKCEKLYLDCFEYEKTRAESLYMIGYYYSKTEHKKAFEYLKRAFEISEKFVPTTMNSKYKINNYNIPKLLLPLCYEFKDIELGLRCAYKCNSFENKDKDKDDEDEDENNLFKKKSKKKSDKDCDEDDDKKDKKDKKLDEAKIVTGDTENFIMEDAADAPSEDILKLKRLAGII